MPSTSSNSVPHATHTTIACRNMRGTHETHSDPITLFSINYAHNFLTESISLLTDFLIIRKSVLSKAANTLRTLWIQNPTVSYRSAFGIGRQSWKVEKPSEKFAYPKATPEAIPFFFCRRLRENEKSGFCISLTHACVPHRNFSSPQQKARSSA